MNDPRTAQQATLAAARPADLRSRVRAFEAELIAFRRDLHRHPELGRQEFRTTGLLRDRLVAAGLEPRVLPGGTGMTVDIVPPGTPAGMPFLAFRADIDALPIDDAKTDVTYRSTVPGRAHACGHDVHTSIVLGTALVLAAAARNGELQPARPAVLPARRGDDARRRAGRHQGRMGWTTSAGSSPCTATPRSPSAGSG